MLNPQDVCFLLVRTCKFALTKSRLSILRFTPEKKEFSIGERIEFSCVSGFMLRGAASYTCASSGQWPTVSWPRCLGICIFTCFLLI